MKKILITFVFVIVIFFGLVKNVQAATYYVSTSGNDNCTGLSNTAGSNGACALKTVQACANKAVAGDTCNIAAGNYGSTTANDILETKASGTSGNTITFQGVGASSTIYYGGIHINHNFITVKGIKFDGAHLANGYSIISIGNGWQTNPVIVNGDNATISDCILTDSSASVLPIGNKENEGINIGSGVNNVTITQNTISNLTGTMFMLLNGTGHIISNNTITGRPSITGKDTFKSDTVDRTNVDCQWAYGDVFYIFSSNMVIDNNTISDIYGGTCWDGNHVDIWQSFTSGIDGGEVANVLIKNNLVKDIYEDAQIGNFDGFNEEQNSLGEKTGIFWGTNQALGGHVLHDWTWYNNVFWNINFGAVNIVNLVNAKWYNNTFYHVGYNSEYGSIILLWTTPGERIIDGITFTTGCTGGEVYNNIFADTGRTTLSYGGYVFEPGAGTGDYNLQVGPGPTWSTKSDASRENHPIAAGDPKFVNATTGNFHLQSSSPLIGKGTISNSIFTTDKDGVVRGAAWDIGAYEYTTACTTPGDFTCNGFEANDIQVMINIILNIEQDSSKIEQAKMNTGDSVDATDLQLLINKVLGIN